jgi:hypothetical protein
MSHRHVYKSLLPPMLLAVLFLVVLVAGQASDAARWSHGGGTGALVPSEGAGYTSLSAAAPERDTSTWPAATKSMDGVRVQYRYPQGWSHDLLFCAEGAAAGQSDGHLPSGCASTDFLAGQKAREVGRIGGQSLTVGGMSAGRTVQRNPASVLVSQIYTVMVYDKAGAPLFGISTQIGPGTGTATLDRITTDLDAILGTMRLEAAP